MSLTISSELGVGSAQIAASDGELAMSAAEIGARADRVDWSAVSAELDAYGCARLPGILKTSECSALASLYNRPEHFRSHIIMARHGFGRGEYRYFRYPLPEMVETLRSTLYPRLAPMANAWQEALGSETRFPPNHEDFLARCHEAGQLRPTPLLLQYVEGDYNCLHQDLYGAHVFPFQVAFLLSSPDQDFTGGEFVVTEQRPRMQSRAEVVRLGQGDAVVFAVHHRPVRGGRGVYRVTLRHGVSRIRSGKRHTMGIIFHDAE
jgi:uncharacterized protein